MKITIRLYRRHDIDLISLYKNPKFNFQEACKIALRGYIQRKPVYIKQPPFTKSKEFKYGYQLILRLDDNQDKDIIEYFEKLRPRYRNEFIRTVLRGSMLGPIAYDCFIEDDDGLGRDELINETSISVIDYPLKGKRGRKADPSKEKKISKKEIPQKQSDTKIEKTENIPVNHESVSIKDIAFEQKDIPKDDSYEEINSNIESQEQNFVKKEEFPIETEIVEEKQDFVKEEINQTINQEQIEETKDQNLNTLSEEDDDDFDLFGNLDNLLNSF